MYKIDHWIDGLDFDRLSKHWLLFDPAQQHWLNQSCDFGVGLSVLFDQWQAGWVFRKTCVKTIISAIPFGGASVQKLGTMVGHSLTRPVFL